MSIHRMPLLVLCVAAIGVAGSPAEAKAPVPPASELSPVITNPWFPLPAGEVATTAGVMDDARTGGRTRATGETQVIAGVRCAVILDTVARNGRPLERTVDYYAQDRAGTVWY